MRIPKSFTLGPHTITVRIVSPEKMQKVIESIADPDDTVEDGKAWGLFIRGENAMYIQEVGKGFCKQQQLHSFWHEYFHALFYALNLECATDEVTVDQCGLLMLQAQQTMKY